MTVRIFKLRFAVALSAALALILPLLGFADNGNSDLSGTTLRGVLSNGDLVLGQKRQSDLTGSSGSGLRGSSGSGLRGSSGSGLRGSSGSGFK